jgi:hypothetical protein
VISAVAFCPHPPLLVPEVAQGAAPELDDLRAACRTALQFAGTRAANIMLLGPGDRARHHPPNARGSLAPYGLPLEIPLGSDAPGPVELPLSLTIGAWLVRDALGPDTGATGWSVGADDGSLPARGEADPALLVVMGDGSARRSTSAPGYLDDRAAGFDKHVADAMASGDPGRLRVDPSLASELLAAGAPAWNAAATLLRGRTFTGDLLFDAAPYGVGYFVATWTADG